MFSWRNQKNMWIPLLSVPMAASQLHFLWVSSLNTLCNKAIFRMYNNLMEIRTDDLFKLEISGNSLLFILSFLSPTVKWRRTSSKNLDYGHRILYLWTLILLHFFIIWVFGKGTIICSPVISIQGLVFHSFYSDSLTEWIFEMNFTDWPWI